MELRCTRWSLAAVLLIGLPEWFRELGNYRMLAFGVAMVLIMVYRPRGRLAKPRCQSLAVRLEIRADSFETRTASD